MKLGHADRDVKIFMALLALSTKADNLQTQNIAIQKDINELKSSFATSFQLSKEQKV